MTMNDSEVVDFFPPLMTVGQVATVFGVTTRTIWAWVSEGRLPKPVGHGAQYRRWHGEDIRRCVSELASLN